MAASKPYSKLCEVNSVRDKSLTESTDQVEREMSRSLNNRVFRISFLISFAGHYIFLTAPGFGLRLPIREKEPAEMAIDFEMENPAFLPKIDIMGEEKKFKKIEGKMDEPRIEPKQQTLLAEQAPPKVSRNSVEEKVNAINPDIESMLRYQDMVKRRIEWARRYPYWAERQKIEGVVGLRFIILSNGISNNIEVVSASGSRLLDEEAAATIKRAGPFPRIPDNLAVSSVQMELSIAFSLK